MLIFDGDSLEDVVNEISRYTSKKVVILGSDIRDMKIGGYFRTGELAPMLDTFEDSFGIKVDEINEDLIYLSKK